MTQVVYRGNLSAAKFPFSSQFQGRTIIVPQYDNVYVPVVASKADEDKDRGIPQIYYCHNVMPTEQGFQAIGFTTKIVGVDNGYVTDNIFLIRSGTDKAYFHHRTDGSNWIWLGANWIQINSVSSYITPITIAYINDETYIFFANSGAYRLDFATNMLVAVTLTGLSVADIIGITSSAGYLIAWSETAVAWSSTIDPTDFVPSLVTGAGGGGVQGARGKINVCAPHALGFIVYTDNNAVAAVYSGNARYPFNFREITGSGGCSSLDLISWDSNTAAHYTYTGSGLQVVAINSASVFLPELTDFLAGKHFETFNEATLQFDVNTFTAVMKKKLTICADRYLVLSYGLPTTPYYSHAIVYDLATRRFGKLKYNHIDCFDWNYFAPELAETPRECIGFLGNNGHVVIVNFAVDNASAAGVLILGKFQYIRQRMLQLEEAHIENVTIGGAFSLYDMCALDGKNTVNYQGYEAVRDGLYAKYLFHEVGVNHSLLYIGAFNIVSFVLHFNVHGKSNISE